MSSRRELTLSGTAELSGTRSFGSGDHQYNVIDVYVKGQGSAVVFLKNGKSADDVVGLRLGVFTPKGSPARFVVVPVYKTVEASVL